MRFLWVLRVLSVFLGHFWLAGWVELLRFCRPDWLKKKKCVNCSNPSEPTRVSALCHCLSALPPQRCRRLASCFHVSGDHVEVIESGQSSCEEARYVYDCSSGRGNHGVHFEVFQSQVGCWVAVGVGYGDADVV